MSNMKYTLKNKEIELTDDEVKEIIKQNSAPKEEIIKQTEDKIGVVDVYTYEAGIAEGRRKAKDEIVEICKNYIEEVNGCEDVEIIINKINKQ